MERKARQFTSYSGTQQFQERTLDVWKGLIDDYEVMNEELYGDIVLDGVEKLDQFFLSLKEVPVYRYIIVRLCNDLSVADNVSQYINMFVEIENNREPSEETEHILLKLTQILREKYEENTKKKAPDAGYIKEKILHFDRDFLMSFLIWAIEYHSDLIEGLLKAVLGGQGLDYYDSEQFLTYLTFAYQYKGVRSRYEIYERLQEIYDAVEPASDREKEAGGTRQIREKADQELNCIDICLDNEVSVKLIKLLQWHKTLKTPSVRTVGREYAKLLDEVQKLYYNEIQNFLWNYEKVQEETLGNRLVEYLDERRSIRLTVTYDGSIDPDVDPSDEERGVGSSAVIFRKGTAIDGENFVYTLETDVHFPRVDVITEVLVPVAAVSQYSISGKKDTIPSGVQLMLCDKEGKNNEKVIEKFKVKAYTFPTKMDKKPVWRSLAKPAYTFDTDGGNGYILVDAAPNFEVIGGKTYFSYEEDGVKYLYVARKDVKFLCKKDIAPYYERGEVLERYKKESYLPKDEIRRVKKENDDLKLERSKLAYRLLKPDLKNGYIEGISNVIYIRNEKPVIYKKDVLMEMIGDEQLKKAMVRTQEPLLLDIEYPANCKVQLKKGTRFVAKQYLKKEFIFDLKDYEQNEFVLLQDIMLPSSNQRTVEVEVVSLDMEARPGVKQKFLTDKAEIRVEYDGEITGRILEVRCGDLPKPRLYGAEKAGYLYVTCECGTIIDKSVRFVAEMKGQKYIFVPVKPEIKVNDSFVECKNIPVFADEQNMYMLSTSESGKHEGEHVLTRANTFFELKETIDGLTLGAIKAENRYLWDPKAQEKAVHQAEFFDYLYSLTDYCYFEEYLPNLNAEHLSVEWFQKMLPQNWTEEEFSCLPMDQARSVLMTLGFLKAAKERELQMEKDIIEDGKGRLTFDKKDFTELERTLDDIMKTCRMDEFYTGKPCDCLLAYLYICDSPVDALRTLFKLTKGRRR